MGGINFHVDKCKIMHIGANNLCHTYTIKNQPLITTSEKKDVRLNINRNLKTSGHCKRQHLR
jgi:hypothetical protein